jgi:hypothetical protein
MGVKANLEPEEILKQIAGIRQMERGKLCLMRAGTYYNHQTWENGRNVVRYVPRERVAELQKAIASYQEYQELTKTYADEIIRRTRQTQTTRTSHRSAKKRKTPNEPGI